MKNSLLTFVVVAASISSCTTTYRGTINSYIDPGYQQGAIKRIAVFSIRNSSRAPSESRRINVELSRAIVNKNPHVDLVSPSEALRTINESNLASEWADFVEDYYTSGIANRAILEKIGEALTVDAVLQGQIENVVQRDGGSGIPGQTRITLSFSIVEVTSAKRIWEVSADGIGTTGSGLFSNKTAPPILDAIQVAVAKVLDNLPHL